jgi:GMP synthase-like glutamine amidotransferase
MRLLVLQHVAFEGPAGLGSEGARRGWKLDVRRVDLGRLPVDHTEYDGLIALGGPMSVNDEATLPWLREEKRLIRDAVEAGKPFLGICLGAQLLASAFGARVYPNAQREIGWFALRAAPGMDTHPVAHTCLDGTPVFHWHGETFELPAGGVHLLESEACRHQAFLLGPRALGLQFHAETTPESARLLVENARSEMIPGPFVQSESAVLDQTRLSRLPALLTRILDAWLNQTRP